MVSQTVTGFVTRTVGIYVEMMAENGMTMHAVRLIMYTHLFANMVSSSYYIPLFLKFQYSLLIEISLHGPMSNQATFKPQSGIFGFQ